MNEVAVGWDEEEKAAKVADGLSALGLSASAQDTGGGIICVIVDRNGGEIVGVPPM